MKSDTPRYCFFVTSVVHPWDDTPYPCGVRSYYSPAQRAVQTIRTIESIRLHCPEAKIVLCEGGAEYSEEIAQSVDKYIYAGKYHFIEKAVSGASKAWGEVWLTLFALPYLRHFDYVWKMSGRYCLTDKFNKGLWISGGGVKIK